MADQPAVYLRGIVGRSAGREVFVGFAPARVLAALSFADVLDEAAGTGYQRRLSAEHSLDFRRYIQRPGSTTIPLTFNLRPRADDAWALVRDAPGTSRGVADGAGAGARLDIAPGAGKVLAQVDCQHRLGHIGDLDLELPFMTFLGLDARAELEIFSVINSKARGLSSSLLDYHDARLAHNLGRERPELLVALHLNDAEDSPWYKQLDLGGTPTSGTQRRASLRTMQKAVRRFLSATGITAGAGAAANGGAGGGVTPEDVARLVLDYWLAVRDVLRDAWADPRRHLLTKGVGVYALMGMLADACREWRAAGAPVADLGRRELAAFLGDFAPDLDWTGAGPLRGLGGESGVREALELLRAARRASPGAWGPPPRAHATAQGPQAEATSMPRPSSQPSTRTPSRTSTRASNAVESPGPERPTRPAPRKQSRTRRTSPPR